MVWAVGEASISGGLVEGALVGGPLILGMTTAHDRAVIAVEFVSEVLVGFHTFEVGKNLVERPLVVAPFRPSVIVLADAAEELGVVDGAGTAGDLAAGYIHVGLGGGASAEVPDVLGVINGPAAVGQPDLFGDAFEFREVAAGFEEEDGAVGVFGESGGEGCSGGTCAYYDVVVFHGVVLSCGSGLRPFRGEFSLTLLGGSATARAALPLQHRLCNSLIKGKGIWI